MKKTLNYLFFTTLPPFLIILVARLEFASVELCFVSQLLSLIIVLKMYRDKSAKQLMKEVFEDAVYPIALGIFSVLVFNDRVDFSDLIYNSTLPLFFYPLVIFVAYKNKDFIEDCKLAMSKLQLTYCGFVFFGAFYVMYNPGFPVIVNLFILILLELYIYIWAIGNIASYKNKLIDIEKTKSNKRKPKKIS